MELPVEQTNDPLSDFVAGLYPRKNIAKAVASLSPCDIDHLNPAELIGFARKVEDLARYARIRADLMER
jgi:hypothetical protein